MNVVVAAIDDSPQATNVLDFAKQIAAPLAADVVALHVRPDTTFDNARAIADEAGVPLLTRTASDDVVAELRSAAFELQGLLVVAGAGRVSWMTAAAGSLAARLVEELEIALLLVPPAAIARPINRLLMCVIDDDGDALTATLEPGEIAWIEEGDEFGSDVWAQAFLGRVAEGTAERVRLDLRVADMATFLRPDAKDAVDLAVLAAHGMTFGAYTRVAQHMLGQATVPVLLLSPERVTTRAETGPAGDAADAANADARNGT